MQQTANYVREQNGVFADLQKSTQVVRDDQLAGKVDALQKAMSDTNETVTRMTNKLDGVLRVQTVK